MELRLTKGDGAPVSAPPAGLDVLVGNAAVHVDGTENAAGAELDVAHPVRRD
ncbi:hypothetical protein SAMN04488543_1953 [Friedmanniella luteola]|uniref:Uncharacterized protein n=1 Tax=Friedmanniella luteola TaxID=546871 RepID=A0A1H1T6Q9_9ACTN|nr:hypothetical protein SAMN04488543_1953 [Friedmanniella luteola]